MYSLYLSICLRNTHACYPNIIRLSKTNVDEIIYMRYVQNVQIMDKQNVTNIVKFWKRNKQHEG